MTEGQSDLLLNIHTPSNRRARANRHQDASTVSHVERMLSEAHTNTHFRTRRASLHMSRVPLPSPGGVSGSVGAKLRTSAKTHRWGDRGWQHSRKLLLKRANQIHADPRTGEIHSLDFNGEVKNARRHEEELKAESLQILMLACRSKSKQ